MGGINTQKLIKKIKVFVQITNKTYSKFRKIILKINKRFKKV